MIDIQTKGWKSSEFIALIVNVVVMVGGLLAKKYGWNVPEEFWTMLLGSFGATGVYSLGRAHYKASKAKAIASETHARYAMATAAGVADREMSPTESAVVKKKNK